MNTADLSPHLDLDTLADLAEGLLDEDQAANAGEHLAGCPQCQDRSAELADVSRLLAEAPMPPLPTAFAQRLDAAIAAEIATNPPGAQHHLAHRRRRHFQLLAAAAAAVVMVGAGATLAKTVLHTSVRPDTLSGKVPDDSPPHSQQDEPSRAVAPRNSVAGEGGTDYRDATLATQIRAALRTVHPAATAGQSSGCVASLAKGATPLLVDVARYDGAPATIVVLKGAGGGYDVWIAGAQCAILKHTAVSAG